IAGEVKNVLQREPPKLPDWVARLPVVGTQLSDAYRQIIGNEVERAEQVKKLTGPFGRLIVSWSRAFAAGLWQFLLSLLIGFFLYRDGEAVAQRFSQLAQRVGGTGRGTRLLETARDTMVGVVYGILGTGLMQGFVVGLGLAVAGIPGALLLGFLAFLLSGLPVGVGRVWLPACIWLATQGHPIAAGLLGVFEILANFAIDFVIKPILIAEGGELPILLVFIGILGGAAAFGFLGVFLGPTLLAIGYSLLEEVSSEATELESEPVKAE